MTTNRRPVEYKGSHKYYNVIFDGIVLSNYDEIEVKEKICALTGVTIFSSEGKRILLGYPVVVKAGLGLSEAEKLAEVIKISGGQCNIVSHKKDKRIIPCAICKGSLLKPIRCSAVEIDICPNCSGMWFEKDEIDKIVLSHSEVNPFSSTTILESLGVYKGLTQKNCPGCNVCLKRYELASGSELDIDVCTECFGIWIDKGKLDHATAFFEAKSALNAMDKELTSGHWLFQFLLSLPVELNVKPKSFPAMTSILILLNALAMTALFYYPAPENVYRSWGLIPGARKTFSWLVTLVSYQFMHGGMIHFISNMYFLYILGDDLEDALGKYHFLAFYILCGVSAGIVQSLFTSSETMPVIGASGAVAGVMAGYMTIFRKAQLTFMFVVWQKKLSAAWYCTIWIVFNMLGALSNSLNVAWYAHLGGFASGLLWAFLIYDKVLQKKPLLKYINKSSSNACSG